jgi:hypothetical protein
MRVRVRVRVRAACLTKSWDEIATLQLCPPLADFTFSGWEPDTDAEGLDCLQDARRDSHNNASGSNTLPMLPDLNAEAAETELDDLDGFDDVGMDFNDADDAGGLDFDAGDDVGQRADGGDDFLFASRNAFGNADSNTAPTAYNMAPASFFDVPGDSNRNVLTLDVMDLLPKTDSKNWTGTHWKFFSNAKASMSSSFSVATGNSTKPPWSNRAQTLIKLPLHRVPIPT